LREFLYLNSNNYYFLQQPEFEIKKNMILAKKTIMGINEDSPIPRFLSRRIRSKSLVKEKSLKPKRRSTFCSMRPFLNAVSTTPRIALPSSSVKRSLLGQKSASANLVS
jgi:hypothetical protein